MSAEELIPPVSQTGPVPKVQAKNYHFNESVALSADKASELTVRSPTQLVMIAGRSDSGKTTLLCSLYERLNSGELFGYRFGGSQTLHAFEKICHASRIQEKQDSDNDPHTSRTLNDWQSQYLHLRFENVSSETVKDVLFSDIEGEVFDNASKTSKDCQLLTQFRRADRVVLLVDGGKILKKNERLSQFESIKVLLRSLLDNKMLSKGSRADILVTKSDLFEGDLQVSKFVGTKFEEFHAMFSDRLASLRFGVISTRPKAASNYDLCHGLENLFPAWIEEGRIGDRRTSIPNSLDTGREIERYVA